MTSAADWISTTPTLTPATRECNACPPIVKRCAHFDGVVLSLHNYNLADPPVALCVSDGKHNGQYHTGRWNHIAYGRSATDGWESSVERLLAGEYVL